MNSRFRPSLETRIRNDSRVADLFHDSDGWWLSPKPGFRNSYDDFVGVLHGVHENSLREIAKRLPGLIPCDCAECQRQT